MTKPRVFRDSQSAIDRGRIQKAQSLQMQEAAQVAIAQTRQLLSEMTRLASPFEEKTE
jgi:hypothetical protein